MDGTILNTLDDLCDATNYSLKHFEMPEHTIDEIRMFVGNGIKKLIERACPQNTSESKINEVFEFFMKYYSEHSAVKTASYPGIMELVSELKKAGIKTAVSTNKANGPAQDLGKKYFNGIFDLIIGQKEGLNIKPAPDSIYEILKILKTDKKDAVYIGDSDVDFMTAKNSGLDFIGVTWGFRGRSFLENLGTKTIVDSTEEIMKIIKEEK